MKKCEEKEGAKFTMCIAHHSFLNPLALRTVIQRRVAEGLPQCPLYCFVHGTALKMYRWELGPKETDEQKSFPMSSHKMIGDEKRFDDQIMVSALALSSTRSRRMAPRRASLCSLRTA